MSSEGIELQHRGKPASVSYEAYDSSPEDQSGRTANNTESSKVHTRQLDVSGSIVVILRYGTDSLQEIHQLFAHSCFQYEYAMLVGSFGSIFYCWSVERRSSM